MKILNARRIETYPALIVALYVVISIVWLAASKNGIDPAGKIICEDFLGFHVAAVLARTEGPMAVYNHERTARAQFAAMGKPYKALPWFYPPIFLLMVYPLGYLHYYMALLIWLTGSLLLYGISIYLLTRSRLGVVIALAFPGAFQNFIQGQNAFIVASAIAAGMAILHQFPLLAGLIFGTLIFKPQFGIVFPILLIAGKHWRALLGLVVAFLFWGIASFVFFGLPAWKAFFENLFVATQIGTFSGSPLFKMVSARSALCLIGTPKHLAAAAQMAIAMVAMSMAGLLWLRSTNTRSCWQLSAAVAAMLLVTPHALDYDLAILAPALVCIILDHLLKDSQLEDMTESLVLVGWFLPFAAPLIAKITSVQVAPLYFAWLLLHSIWKGSRATS